MDNDPSVKSSLGKEAVTGAKWMVAASLVSAGIAWLQLVALTRLLLPGDFGLMSMIVVVLGFVAYFVDLGTSNAIIYHQDVTSDQLSSLYWLNFAAGALMFVILILTSPLVVAYYNEPRLRSLLILAATMFLIQPIGLQFQVLLQKSLRFKALAVIEVLITLAGAVVAVGSALIGQGVKSLIWGQLGSAALRAAILVALGIRLHRPRLHFRLADVRGYLGFGAFQMSERSIGYLYLNIDNLLVGRYLGSQVLGFYSIAYQLIRVPVARLGPVIGRVAFPVFARRQNDDAEIRRGALKVVRLTGFLVIPLLAGLTVLAPHAIPVLFGPRWAPSVVLVQILAPLGAMMALETSSNPILLSKGRADLGFLWNLLDLVVLGGSLLVSVRFGVEAVAATCLGTYGLLFVVHRLVIRHVIGLKLRDYFASLVNPLVAALLMSVIVYLWVAGFSRVVDSHLVLLLGGTAVGAASYFAIFLLMDRPYLVSVRSMLFNR